MFPTQLYSTHQLKIIEQHAIDELALSKLTLMQRAAQAAFTVIKKRWGTLNHLAIFCGKGHNAGEGYFIATLALQANISVDLYPLNDPEDLTELPLSAYQHYQQRQHTFNHPGNQVNLANFVPPDLIVDCLFGTGLNREVLGDDAKAIAIINQCSCPVFAIDIPSGLHAETGNVLGCAVKADVTLSFIGLKPGLFTADGVDYCGDILWDNLGIPKTIFSHVSPSAQRLTSFPFPQRLKNTHKGNFGHVCIVGGDIGFSGAARLAAEAALRTGAGLVSVGTHPSHASGLNIGCFELMVHGITDAQSMQMLLKKTSVIVLGVGLGQQPWGEFVFNQVRQRLLPMIIDANGLIFLARTPDYHDNRILTPHPKEAAQLLKTTTIDIMQNRFKAVKEIQRQYGGICILKGAGTLVADHDGIYVNTTGNPGMATAGMGDVLAGMVAALVAQKFSFIKAATLAVYLHGKAADIAAKQGQRGLIASDLFPIIRRLLN